MYFAVNVDALSIHEYFKNTSNSLVRLANSIGAASLILGMIALMLKDLESLADHRFGQHAVLGKVGGVIRRLAGDLTLWTLGLIVTILCVVAVAGYTATNNLKEGVILAVSYTLLLTMAFVVAVFNFLIRREEPPFASVFKKTWVAIICYTVFIPTVVYAVYFKCV